ncbi:MAG: 50S ribosomal protein L6 [SAR324 cluster bacterium]|uniref:50S ribosomal protein L6 n=1 Tax=SAR324 cluster bacterium TaxID=2024889 RepID=A0A2A4TAH3_9DELT|nr:MAG: 50S ribosomal protein L6 [SAR324 cluster bacterium]
MSRLGRKAVPFSEKVKVSYSDKNLTVSGSNGEMNFAIPAIIDLEIGEGEIAVKADFGTTAGSSLGGTIRSVINNMVVGVTEGFSKTLVLVGVGYRAQVSGQSLVLSLGFSHNIDYALPKQVKAEVKGPKITLSSCNKQLLGQVAAEIRKYRPPEPYKGKGILFEGEKIVRKAGKTAKK